MNFLRFSAFALPLIVAIAAGLSAPCQAQPPDALGALALPDLDVEIPQWRPLKLAHVAPSVMAARLDPRHYTPAPAWFAADARPAPATPGTLAMYGDIAGIVPVDAQQTLLVLGTAEETGNLRNLIATLDQPGSMATLQIMVIAADARTAATLGVRGLPARTDADGNPVEVSPPPPTPFISAAGGEAIAQAQKLAMSGKAVILSEKSVSAALPLNTSVVLTMSAPRDISEGRLSALPAAATAGAFRDVSSLSLQLSKGGAESIALSLRSARHLMWVPAPGSPASKIALQTREGGDAIVNVKDGETIALFGFPDDAFPAEIKPAQEAANSTVILLIQTRIAH